LGWLDPITGHAAEGIPPGAGGRFGACIGGCGFSPMLVFELLLLAGKK
jgi:hypothetical protein